VELLDGRPATIDEVGPEGEDKLAYEFHEWSGESRRMMGSLLLTGQVVHAWQGTTLFIREQDEDTVDAIVEQVEASTLPTLDPEADRTAFVTEQWSAEQQMQIVQTLATAGIPSEIDAAGDLVVHQSDDDDASDIIEAILDGADVDMSVSHGDDGLDAQKLLGDLFLAASSIRKNPVDYAAAAELAELYRSAEGAPLPFGFGRASWREILGASADLLNTINGSEDYKVEGFEDADGDEHVATDEIDQTDKNIPTDAVDGDAADQSDTHTDTESEPESDTDAEEEEELDDGERISASASTLRDLLRPYV
jgi:hypothetical protein